MKLIIVRGVEHLLGEGVWNPLQRGHKGHPTLYMYMYMYHNHKLITKFVISATTVMPKRNIYIIYNVNIPFTHDSGSTG